MIYDKTLWHCLIHESILLGGIRHGCCCNHILYQNIQLAVGILDFNFEVKQSKGVSAQLSEHNPLTSREIQCITHIL
jgi:hypothetical protein